MASILDFLRILSANEVEYVVVGGVAGVLHGSQIVTEDVDICAPLSLLNLERILAALRGFNPRFRMSPDNRPLPDRASALAGFKNLYLVTDLGQIDILSTIDGVGEYAEVARHTICVDLGGFMCRVLDLDTLIQAKSAVNSPKDRQAVLELKAIRERIQSRNPRGQPNPG